MRVARLAASFVLSTSLWAAPSWMEDQARFSTTYLMDNISPRGAVVGSVVASPSRSAPDYFYHWIRDAALVMSTVVQQWKSETDPTLKAHYEQILTDYIAFSRGNQTTPNLSDKEKSGRVGEPKFNADGSAFNQGWGRPQNDGPALRALTLTRLARAWMAEGREKDVRRLLYDGKSPTNSLLKTDLEFVSHHWTETSYDIWEEISGQQFYHRLVQRRALIEGAELASLLGDLGASSWYESQVASLEKEIEKHWDGSKNLIVPTLDRDRGLDTKKSGMDSSVLLAVLHASGNDSFYSAADSRVLSTAAKLVEKFNQLYPVNSKGYAAVAMGRYPEDTYDGVTTSGSGNPWFLTTAAMAELNYRVARIIEGRSSFRKDALNEPYLRMIGAKLLSDYRGADKNDLVLKIREMGDAFLGRVGFHADKDGHLSEQIHRDSGYTQGAANLTWSYASFLTAYWLR